MKKLLSKQFVINEFFAEMEADKSPILAEEIYLEDCVTSIIQRIKNCFQEPLIGDWFYGLDPYDQALLLLEAVNCLAKYESPSWYHAKDFIVDVLLNGKTSTGLPPDAIVWMEESWGMPALELYSRVVGTISVHLPGWDFDTIGDLLDERRTDLGKAWFEYRPWSGVHRQWLGVRMLQDQKLLQLMAEATRPSSMPTLLSGKRKALANYLGVAVEEL